MDHQKLLELIDKLYAGTVTEAESAALEAYYDAFDQKAGYMHHLNVEQRAVYKEIVFAEITKEFAEPLNFETRTLQTAKKFKLWPPITKISAAAAIALMVFGIYFFKSNKQDLPPGRNTATLTLADGKRIILSDAKNGELARQTGVSISKTKDGQVIYHVDGQSNTTLPVTYNTLSTARGETYTIELQDGTTVTLNAASSLKFPTTFSDLKERNVELSGEGYFSVKHDVQHPFKVKTAKQLVEDLGTEFNINAYHDEPLTKTTLLEGSLQIVLPSSSKATLLKPGQQAVVGLNKSMEVSNVNITEAIAWKNGFFQFENAGVEAVMRQLRRWYDVDIVYEGEIPNRSFTGKIYRNLNASEALKGLKFTGLNFKIEGKKIIVTN